MQSSLHLERQQTHASGEAKAHFANSFRKLQNGTYNKTIGLFVRALFRLYKM
jgi:hypothetical protein